MIRVLGTGAADGWPNPFCTCASCMSSRALGVVRAQTSVRVDDFLLDFGPDTARSAERAGVPLADVRHVLLTHNHPDHTAPAFLLYRSWVVGDDPLDVVGPSSVIANARMWLAPDTPVLFHVVTPGDVLELAGGTVRVLDAAHDGDAVLYDVSAPSGRILYATDTGPLPDSTVSATRGAAYSVVFLEQTFGDFTDHGTAHLDLPAFAEQVRRLRGTRAIVEDTELIAVHLSHHNPPLPELDRRLAAYGARTVLDGTELSVGRPPLPPADPAEPPPPVVEPGKPPMPVVEPGEPPGRARIETPRAASVGTIRPNPLRTLVIGGARSGKSSEAERILHAAEDVTYVATSYPRSQDPEWIERVRLHRQQRPAHWTTVESLDLVKLLGTDGGPLLIDCLTLWLTRIMDRHDAWNEDAWVDGGAAALHADVAELAEAWRTSRRRVVAVTNEVGQGLVPAEAPLRRFRDEMGRLNSAIAARTEDVRFCIAGRVLPL